MDAIHELDDADPVHRAAVTMLASVIRQHAREHPPTGPGDEECQWGICGDAAALARAVLERREQTRRRA